jgi:drug/metabolite transporter (DMT)-like permease
LGIALDLSVLLAMAVLGPAFYAVFEVETPAWRKLFKWGLVIGVTLVLTQAIGHWALLVPVLGAAAGLTAHFAWCRRHGIDPVHATPRRRYYELRGWTWRE